MQLLLQKLGLQGVQKGPPALGDLEKPKAKIKNSRFQC